ncbi:MAG: hypothetical protein WBC18_07945 [Ottowia sp.]|uniref:hypothetical protein n=1 Tax=Ottowia sp. TaxID=1898956 RepID=UPI003C748B6D
MNAAVHHAPAADQGQGAPSIREICESLDSAPSAAHQRPAPTIERLGTLAREYVSKYLIWITEDQQHAHLLKQMHDKRKAGQARDAIWSGYWTLKGQAERYTTELRDMGGLLYVGQASAIEAARRVLKGGAA